MHTIQLRNLPKEVYDGVKLAAEESRRSMTQLVIFAIEEYLADRKTQNENLARKNTAIKKIEDLQKNAPINDLKMAMKWINEDKK
jgi:predicted nucleotidyltransferase component of viral defense system